MKELNNHIVFKSAAKLVIVASVLCVLFGNGTHFHSVFNHFFDHGDIHAYVHAHPDDLGSGHDHAKEFDGKDAHQHPTATVDLTGTLTQKTTSKAYTSSDLFSSSGIFYSHSTSQTPILLYLDLPPPDLLYQSSHFSSYSLRGPPLG